MAGYNDFGDFRSQMLAYRAGPLESAVEDMADEMFHTEIQEEFGGLWDKVDSDE